MNYYNTYSPYSYPNSPHNPYAATPTYPQQGVGNGFLNVPQPQSQQPSPQQLLNGKMVENEDMVKVTEVPIGGYGIFPKADFSEIYIKSWNSNGTTSITTFRPFVAIQEEESPKQDNISLILDKIDNLEQKITSALDNKTVVTTVSKPQKEVNF